MPSSCAPYFSNSGKVEDFALGGLTLHPNIIAGAAAATYALKLIGIDLSPRTIAWDVM
jgi:hypothetical protein